MCRTSSGITAAGVQKYQQTKLKPKFKNCFLHKLVFFSLICCSGHYRCTFFTKSSSKIVAPNQTCCCTIFTKSYLQKPGDPQIVGSCPSRAMTAVQVLLRPPSSPSAAPIEHPHSENAISFFFGHFLYDSCSLMDQLLFI